MPVTRATRSHDVLLPTGITPTQTLDCSGMRCPQPIIMLARAAAALPARSIVALLADDPAARLDIPAWCRLRDARFLGEDAVEERPRYWVATPPRRQE
jgi:tRNA 2-thiouridine synthesizing protein A